MRKSVTSVAALVAVVTPLALFGPVQAIARAAAPPEPAAQQVPAQQVAASKVGAFEPTRCWFPLPPGTRDGRDVKCGYVTVPRRHAKPSAGTIKLGVAVVKALNGKKAPDAVAVLTGGPGQSAVVLLAQSLQAPLGGVLTARKNRDVVFVDQRGTGFGTPHLSCDELADGSTDDPVAACYKRLSGVTELSAFNTAQNAQDFDVVRRALGYRSWNLYGVSYGSKLGYNILRYAPKGTIRSAILSSIAPHRPNWFPLTPVSFQAALDELYRACKADTPCRTTYGDLRATTERAYDELTAEPLTVQLGGAPLTLTNDFFAESLVQWLYSRPLTQLLPEFLTAVETRDVPRVERVFDIISGGAGAAVARALAAPEPAPFDPTNNEGMYASVLCAEELRTTTPAQLRRNAAKVSNVAAGILPGRLGLLEVCSTWKVAKATSKLTTPVRTKVPTLVVSGAYDPVTPAAFGSIMAKTLSRSQHVVIRATGHSPLESAGTCANKLISAFYAKPGSIDASCAKAELTFVIPTSKASVQQVSADLRSQRAVLESRLGGGAAAIGR